MKINSFHIYWSPSEKQRDFKSYFVLMTIHSALEWKKNHQGSLNFYADRYTAEYFYKNNIASFWDKIDDKSLDKEIDKQIYDTSTFYAIGKFLAFMHEKASCSMVDIDLVVWKNLEKILNGKKSVFTHYERTTPASP